MKKKSVSVSLPMFLNESGIFPAFIINSQGEIVATNKLFVQQYALVSTETNYIQRLFTDNSFTPFLKSYSTISAAAPMIIFSNVNNCVARWEVACFDNEHFICTGTTQPATDYSIPAQNRFSIFFDNSPALMWVTDQEGRILMMNNRYKEYTGFTDEQLGKTIWEVYPREMADQFKRNDDAVLQSNKMLEREEISIDKAGKTRNYIAYKFPLQTAGKGTMVAGCSIDITDVIEKTQQLSFQTHLLDSVEQGVYILDPENKIIYWSKFAEEMFGWKKEEILNIDINILTSDGILDEMIADTLLSKQGWHGEIELKRKDGTLIQVHATKSPVLDKNNNVSAIIGICKDITERKTVHKKLIKQNNQFRQIARLQSHAVRRPLANMLGLIDLIQYYADKKEYEEVMYMIGMLKQSSEDLDDIIRRIVLKAGVYFDPELRIA